MVPMWDRDLLLGTFPGLHRREIFGWGWNCAGGLHTNPTSRLWDEGGDMMSHMGGI